MDISRNGLAYLISKIKEPIGSEDEKPSGFASVLIPFLWINDRWEILFEVRSGDLKVQPGDICLPGGGRESEETSLDTALRETCEELLIKPADINNVFDLGEIPGPGGQRVSIFSGEIFNYDFTFATDETEEVFSVPLNWFLDNPPKKHIIRMVPRPDEDFPFDDIYGGKDYPLWESKREVLFYYYKDRVIWGFTARVIDGLIRLVTKIL